MKKFIIFVFIISFVLVLKTFAQESRWRKLNASDILYDTKTLKKTSNKVNVWIKYLREDKSYKMILTELDCENLRIRTNNYISYNGEGNVVDSSRITTTWTEIIPESNGESYYNILCKNEPDLESKEEFYKDIDRFLNTDSEVKDNDVFVLTNKANLRKMPSLESEVVGVLSKGTKLTVKEELGNWYLVSDVNVDAWIHKSTVSKISLENINKETPVKSNCENENALVVKFDKTNIYKSPSGVTIQTLSKGTKLNLLSKKSFSGLSWVKVTNRGIEGYIYSDLLEKDCHSNNLIVRIPKTTTKPPTDSDSFQAVYTGRDEEPSISIINSTNKTMTLVFGGVKYTIPSNEIQQITVEGGNYEFTVSATGVRSLSGVKTFNRGYGYTWTFTIVTTRY